MFVAKNVIGTCTIYRVQCDKLAGGPGNFMTKPMSSSAGEILVMWREGLQIKIHTMVKYAAIAVRVRTIFTFNLANMLVFKRNMARFVVFTVLG